MEFSKVLDKGNIMIVMKYFMLALCAFYGRVDYMIISTIKVWTTK